MIPPRYVVATQDIFSYEMGDGPAGSPRFFIARTWLLDNTPVAWLMNAMRLDEAAACSQIIHNILIGLYEDVLDLTVSADEEMSVLSKLEERIVLLHMDQAMRILDGPGIPIWFDKKCHETIRHIDVIPFAVETGFHIEIVDSFVGRIPIK